jgi:hypothetical protein
MHQLPYEVKAELAVIFAAKMDKVYKALFFKKLKPKFLKELKYLSEETLYKIIWSMLKAEEI